MSFTTFRKLIFAFALFFAPLAYASNCPLGDPCPDLNRQIQGSRLPSWSTDSGSANAYVLTTIAAIGSSGVLQTGSCFGFIATHANTGASTAAIDGGSAIAIKRSDGTTALSANDIVGLTKICYDGTNFRLPPSGGATSFSGLSGTLGCSQEPGGSCAAVKRIIISYAGCNGGTAYPAWNLPSSSAMGAACTSDNQEGNLTAADGQLAYVDFTLPADYSSFSSVTINFTTTDTTNGHTVIWNLATYCVQPNNNVANPNAPTYNSAGSVTTTIGSSAVSAGVYQATISSLTMTGCSAGYKLRLKFSRATDTDTDTAVQLTDGLTFAYNGSFYQ